MKHLNFRSAICLPAFLVLVFFASSLFAPHTAFAKVEYANGSGMAEGDPTDGWGFSSGGSGLLSGGSKNVIEDYAGIGVNIFPDIEVLFWYFQLNPEYTVYYFQPIKVTKKHHIEGPGSKTRGIRQ